MPFSDPSSGFFSPNMPNTGPVEAPSARMAQIPNLENIGSPRSQPFEMVRPVNYEPDNTGGTIAKGIAQSLDTSVTAVDSALKVGIDNKVRSGVEALLNKQIQAGLDTKQDLLQDQDDKKSGMQDAPTGFTQGLSKLDTIDKAARSGAMSNSNFYARANDLVAELKTNYPGYGSVVDDKMKSILGVDPKEGVRLSLQKDIDALRKAQADRLDYIDKYLLTNQADLPSDWMKRPRDEMIGYVQKANAFRNKASDDELKRKVKVNAGLDDSEDAIANFSWQAVTKAADMTNELQKNVEKATGKSLNQILAGGVGISPQDKENFLGVLRQMQPVYYSSLNQILGNTNLPDSDPSHSIYASLARSGKADQADKVAKQFDPFQRIIDAATTGNWALVGEETRNMNAIVDGASADMFKNNPVFLRQALILKNTGPAFGQLLLGNGKLQLQAANVVSRAFDLINREGDETYSDTIKQYGDQHKTTYGSQPNDMGKKITEKVTLLSNTDVDKATQEKQFRSVFLDKDPTYLIDQIKKGDSGMSGAMDVFMQHINPAVIKNAKFMPEDIKNGIQTWAKTNFSKLSNRLGDDINANATASPYYDVTYDKAAGQFVTVPTELGRKNPGLYQQNVNNFTSLNKLNAGLQAMKPVVEMGGGDMNQYVATIMPGLLLSPEQLKKDTTGKAFQTETSKSNYNKQGSFKSDADLLGQPSKPLLDLIRKGEASGSYDPMFGVKGARISSMTVDEVLAKQRERIAEQKAQGKKPDEISSASGGYQFINETLNHLKTKLGLKGDEKMTPELQDRLGHSLADEAGYSDYKSGKISKYEFANNLSKKWAALPNMSGKGSLDGIGTNKSNISLTDLLTTIDGL